MAGSPCHQNRRRHRPEPDQAPAAGGVDRRTGGDPLDAAPRCRQEDGSGTAGQEGGCGEVGAGEEGRGQEGAGQEGAGQGRGSGEEGRGQEGAGEEGSGEEVRELSPADAADLLTLAVGLAQEAAEVLRHRPAELGVSTKSSPTDVVTVMDKAAERVILDGLAAARPEDTVISEEGGGKEGSSSVSWLVDPLDGTVNYLYGITHYAVSVAAQ